MTDLMLPLNNNYRYRLFSELVVDNNIKSLAESYFRCLMATEAFSALAIKQTYSLWWRMLDANLT